eukprot:1312173-Amphidinium_carterae.1
MVAFWDLGSVVLRNSSDVAAGTLCVPYSSWVTSYTLPNHSLDPKAMVANKIPKGIDHCSPFPIIEGPPYKDDEKRKCPT